MSLLIVSNSVWCGISKIDGISISPLTVLYNMINLRYFFCSSRVGQFTQYINLIYRDGCCLAT